VKKLPYELIAFELTEARRHGATIHEIAEGIGYSKTWVSVVLRWYERCYGSASTGTSRNGLSRACAACGQTFTWTRADARYCSNVCRQRAYRQRKRGDVVSGGETA
jgi:hypothetical protein